MVKNLMSCLAKGIQKLDIHFPRLSNYPSVKKVLGIGIRYKDTNTGSPIKTEWPPDHFTVKSSRLAKKRVRYTVSIQFITI